MKKRVESNPKISQETIYPPICIGVIPVLLRRDGIIYRLASHSPVSYESPDPEPMPLQRLVACRFYKSFVTAGDQEPVRYI
jgi:hypothetical protein